MVPAGSSCVRGAGRLAMHLVRRPRCAWRQVGRAEPLVLVLVVLLMVVKAHAACFLVC